MSMSRVNHEVEARDDELWRELGERGLRTDDGEPTDARRRTS
jgi:hypothetical protein